MYDEDCLTVDMPDSRLNSVPDSARLSALTRRRRLLFRLGLTVMMLLLAVASFWSYQVQRSLSDDAAQIYRLHIEQDEALQRLRRTLWQSSILVRDLLLSDLPDRRTSFEAALAAHRRDASEAADWLRAHPIPGQDLARLQTKLTDFWATVSAVPEVTFSMDHGERFRYIQSEIASRRIALSALLQEVTGLSRRSLEAGEGQLRQTRSAAAWRLALLMAMVLVTGLAIALLSLRRISGLELQTLAQYDEVAATRSELRALSAQLMSLQENERARLSRELHDEIGQALATLRLELARLESSVRVELPDMHARLGRARAIVDVTVKAVRNISLMLRPSLLDDLGLVSAVQWLAEDFERRTGIACRVREVEPIDDLPVEHRTCIYRVAQEALHNVEKHAGAGAVTIVLEQTPAELLIRIDDDGRGFAAEPPGRRLPRLGILGMRERVTALGGRFEAGPAPQGTGTRIAAAVPLPGPRPDAGRPPLGPNPASIAGVSSS